MGRYRDNSEVGVSAVTEMKRGACRRPWVAAISPIKLDFGS
ncbi:MAG: hypothetical protein O4861_21110 [Trichodesmium sp. St16_bin4-tuft]|nr:hypothetical protein [Trichodesmium sp. St4_bin8_1]MDE5072686.1 hypothetical protein [Trichodesmium sp. St5_bin8]MDE5076963.1 hypothetical protein [Trichodesmium sp. St2_bin6]MDE5090867.1 hypothetical protein [Trichodesmium sp. St18_bin3_1_1]MDE5095726.1 hypothetical protein [Trichodesmium sp. St11_bin5]MDE5100694.1 hypothetical protein [Trichodesmium sp. St16_bin4-tuft]MDE5101895.1 hypothetical protein [Trichodesmium sp. St19_bin2]MDT9339550.1 hypothetical protein [Trichodesmium erythrae